MERIPVDDDDDEIGVVYNPLSPKKGSKWLILGAFFELIGDLFKAFHSFFYSLTEESLAKYRAERSRQAFAEQASREIEMLTSGEFDAPTAESGRSFGPGPSIEEN
jgi:hypothetical protein